MQSTRRPLKVGIDLSPIAFRSRAPGTAVLVENQARALLALPVDWQWVLVATPRTLADTPFFGSFDPIVVPDAPLSYHVSWRLGPLWRNAGCSLGLATAFFASLTGPPVVTNYFDANALHPVKDALSFRDQLKSMVIKGIWNLSRRRSRALFILSEYGRARMIAAEPSTASKWVVTPCGVIPRPPAPAATPGWARSLEGRPFVLYAGAFSENKNQRRLIEAWDQMRRENPAGPQLLLLGPVSPTYLREVIEPARARTLHPEEVIVPGFVSEGEAAWAFQNAHAYIQPSFAEGFGMPVVEAMTAELPVACSDSTSLPEVAGDAAILFEPSDVASIARALKAIVFDEAARSRLVSAGKVRASLFTWKNHAEIVARRIGLELERITARKMS